MPPETRTRLLERERLDDLLLALVARGYRLLGPTVRDGAIVYDELESSADLPEGWTDEQDGGTYRLRAPRGRRRCSATRSGRGRGSSSSGRRACGCGGRSADGDGASRSMREQSAPPQRRLHRRALVRPARDRARSTARCCDVPHPDPGYAARRANVFIVALNCWQAGGTCFCVSMGTGPRATSASTWR